MLELRNYIGKKDFVSVAELVEVLNHRMFRIGDTDVNSRNHFTWHSNGLLYDLPEESQADKKGEKKSREWTNLHLLGFLWLQCVSYLRMFGVPLDIIKQYRDILCTPKDNSELHKFSGVSVMDALKQTLEQSNIPVEQGMAFVTMLAETKLIEASTHHKTPMLAGYVFGAIIDPGPAVLHFYANGTVAIPFADNLLLYNVRSERIPQKELPTFWADLEEQLAPQPYIRMDVMEFLTRFLTDHSKALFLEKTTLLPEKEREVIAALRSGAVKKVSVEYYNSKEKDTRSLDIEYKRSGIVDQDQYEKILSLMLTHKHVKVNISKTDGTVVKYDATTRKRIKG